MEILASENLNHYWEIYQDSGVEGSMKKIGWSIRLMKKMSILFHADTIIRE